MAKLNKYKVVSIALAVILFFTAIPWIPIEAETNTEETMVVSILRDGAKVNSLQMSEDEEVTLQAAISDVEAENYAWQVQIDAMQDIWVDISGYHKSIAKVNYALLSSLFDDDRTAYIRCVVSSGGSKYTSAAVAVRFAYHAVEEVKPEDAYIVPEMTNSEVPSKARMSKARSTAAAANVQQVHKIEVRYIFENGEQAASSSIYNELDGQRVEHLVTLPSVPGYEPYYDSDVDGTLDTKLDGTFNVNIENLNAPVVYLIIYRPALTKYKVVHHMQNLDGFGYDSRITEENYQLTGYQVPENLHKTAETDSRFEGFSYLSYRRLNVAADGQTTIDIYYNRNFYLVNYDLGDKDGDAESVAFGVKPIYVRYGTTVVAKDPTRPGYDFAGWELVEVGGVYPTDEQKSIYDLNAGSITVPAANLKFLAKWGHGTSSFTVVYLRETEGVAGDAENPNAKVYEYWGSKIYGGFMNTSGEMLYDDTVYTGDFINPADYKDVPASISEAVVDRVNDVDYTIDEKPYFVYNEEKSDTDSIRVSGDGTTVIEIYYDRKEYTMKFYYAYTDTSDGTHYVIGRTNYFGYEAPTKVDRNSEIALFDQYSDPDYSTSSGWFGTKPNSYAGQVDEIPRLKSEYADKFVAGQKDISIANPQYEYHYISFKAKYGDDITSYWPVNAFESATRSGDNADENAGWDSNEAIFSAWNGEYNVHYTRNRETLNNGNETVKGRYHRLDYRLLWDHTQSPNNQTADSADNNTVAYLAFWENAFKASSWGTAWNIPVLFRYNVYLECLNQTTPTESGEIVEFKGKKYYLAQGGSYDVCDNSDVQEQTRPPVYGFKNVNNATLVQGSEYREITDFDTTQYKEGYECFFFYDRIRYNLEFYNEGRLMPNKDAQGNDVPNLAIRYGVSLYQPGGNDIDATENYPSWSLEPGGYEFEGWYNSPNFAESTKFEFDENSSMPAHDMVLYANWVLKEHQVWIYNSEKEMESNQPAYPNPVIVKHNSYAPTPQEPDNTEHKSFAGWFYYDENGDKQIFVFSDMKIKSDMHIFAEYNSDLAVKYSVHFVTEDENGVEIEVAQGREAYAPVGTHITAYAKSGVELDADYQERYFVDMKSKDLEITEFEQDNVIKFYYTKKASVPYKVRYVDEEGNAFYDEDGNVLETIVMENYSSVVTETFVTIPGYLPDAYQKRLVLSSSATDSDNDGIADDNVLTFVYSPNVTDGVYRIVHHLERLSDDTYAEYTSIDGVDTLGKIITTDVLEITGYTFKEARINNIKTTPADGKVSAEITEDGLIIDIYYKRRSDVEYTVKYLESGTDRELYTSKIVKNQKHGVMVVETYQTIAGYVLTDGEMPQKAITVLANDTNEIVFYYSEQRATFTYTAVGDEETLANCSVTQTAEIIHAVTGIPKGSGVHVGKGYRFVGWFEDEQGRFPVDFSMVSAENQLMPIKTEGGIWTDATYYALFEPSTADLEIATAFPIIKGEYSKLEPNQTFLFRITGKEGTDTEDIDLTIALHGKQSITVTDLPIGEYTVEEMTDWAWRYTTVDTMKEITLAPKDNRLVFTMTRTQVYWLDGDCYDVNIFNGIPHN